MQCTYLIAATLLKSIILKEKFPLSRLNQLQMKINIIIITTTGVLDVKKSTATEGAEVSTAQSSIDACNRHITHE